MKIAGKLIIAAMILILVAPTTVYNFYTEDDIDGKKAEIEEILDDWCIEYEINPESVTFMGYKNLGKSGLNSVMGRCHWENNSCEIWLDDKWENKKLGWLEISVLWHEYCHAEYYLEYHTHSNHSAYFQSQMQRNMSYWVGDGVAQMTYPFFL